MSASVQARQGFFKYITDFRNVGALIGKGALAAPIVSLIYNVGPPWPSRIAIPILTSMMEVLILIYVFQFWKPLSKTRKQRRMKLSLIAAVLSFLLYFWLFGSFIFNAPDARHRDVRGLIYTEAAESVIDTTYPEQDALKGAGFDPTRIWKPWTVYLMRFLVLVSWLVFFASISVYLATFVLLKR